MSRTTVRVDDEAYEVNVQRFTGRPGYAGRVSTLGFNGEHVDTFTVIKDTANNGFNATLSWGSVIFDKTLAKVVDRAAYAVIFRAKEQALAIAENPGDNVIVAFRNVPGYNVPKGWLRLAYKGAGRRSLYLIPGAGPDAAQADALAVLGKKIEGASGTLEHALFTNIHDALRWVNEGASDGFTAEEWPIDRGDIKRTVLGQSLLKFHPDQAKIIETAQRRAEEIREAAEHLLSLIDVDEHPETSYVPSSTGHWAVEQAKRPLRALAGNAALTPAQLIQGVRV